MKTVSQVTELNSSELIDIEGGFFIPIALGAAALWGAYYGGAYTAGQTYYNLTH